MGLLNFFKKTELQSEVITTPISKAIGSNLSTFNINVEYGNMGQDLQKTGRGYLFGDMGYFPQELNALYHASPLHASILNFKRLLTSGNEYSIQGSVIDGANKISLNQLTNQFDVMMDEVTMDYFIHSRVCLKITWNSDNTKILKVKRISPDKIRVAEVDDEMEPECFFYSWDWMYQSKYPMIKYAKFDQMNKKDKVQIYQYQVTSPGQKLYAEPSYKSALNWVILDSEMAQYHKANITNSINPSMLIQYFEKPGTKEEKQQVLFDLNNSFAGARKTGRAMVTFSDGKDLAPTVTQMDANKLDKTFLQLTDTIQRQICYAHQLDPQLLGLKTPGSLGNSGDFIYSFNLFNKTIIQPAQKDLEKIFNNILAINGLPVKLKYNDATIEKFQPSLAVAAAPATPVINEAMGQEGVKASEPVNDAVKNLTAKQHQQLLRIIRQYGKDQLTREAASTLLKSGLGMSEEDINAMLGE